MDGNDSAALEDAVTEGEHVGLPDEAGSACAALEGERWKTSNFVVGCQVLLEAYEAMPRVAAPARKTRLFWALRPAGGAFGSPRAFNSGGGGAEPREGDGRPRPASAAEGP